MQRPEFLVVFRIISEYNEYDWSVNKMTRTVKREITEQRKKTIPYFAGSLILLNFVGEEGFLFHLYISY